MMALGAKAIFYSSLDLKYLAGSDTQQVLSVFSNQQIDQTSRQRSRQI